MTPDLYYLSLTALLGSVLWIGHVIAIVTTHGFHGPQEYREARIQDLPNDPRNWIKRNRLVSSCYPPDAALE